MRGSHSNCRHRPFAEGRASLSRPNEGSSLESRWRYRGLLSAVVIRMRKASFGTSAVTVVAGIVIADGGAEARARAAEQAAAVRAARRRAAGRAAFTCRPSSVQAHGACAQDVDCVDGLTCVGWTENADGVCKQPPALTEPCGAQERSGLHRRSRLQCAHASGVRTGPPLQRSHVRRADRSRRVVRERQAVQERQALSSRRMRRHRRRRPGRSVQGHRLQERALLRRREHGRHVQVALRLGLNQLASRTTAAFASSR